MRKRGQTDNELDSRQSLDSYVEYIFCIYRSITLCGALSELLSVRRVSLAFGFFFCYNLPHFESEPRLCHTKCVRTSMERNRFYGYIDADIVVKQCVPLFDLATHFAHKSAVRLFLCVHADNSCMHSAPSVNCFGEIVLFCEIYRI